MGVEFDEKNYSTDPGLGRPVVREEHRSKIAGLVVKMRIVKTEKQAQYVLVFLTIILLLITGFVVFNFLLPQDQTPVAPPGMEYEYPPNEPPHLQKI